MRELRKNAASLRWYPKVLNDDSIAGYGRIISMPKMNDMMMALHLATISMQYEMDVTILITPAANTQALIPIPI